MRGTFEDWKLQWAEDGEGLMQGGDGWAGKGREAQWRRCRCHSRWEWGNVAFQEAASEGLEEAMSWEPAGGI